MTSRDMVPCRVCGQSSTYRGLQLCHTHYEKLRRSGTLEYRKRVTECVKDKCGKRVLARSLCRNHYMKLKRTGTLKALRHRRLGWSRSDWHRYSRYRVTKEEFDEQLERQDRSCLICRVQFGGDGPKPYQDHDHKTGQIRGLLCRECNLVLAAIESRGIPAQFYSDYLDDWKFYAEDEDAS